MMRAIDERVQEGKRGPKVGDHMDADLLLVGSERTMHDVLRSMMGGGGWVAVIKDADEVIGIVTASDIIHLVVSGNDLDAMRARDFMTACKLSGNRPCLQISSSDTVDDALKIMSTYGLNTILVYDEKNKLAGTISALSALKGWEEGV